jgi:hypothetical protein
LVPSSPALIPSQLGVRADGSRRPRDLFVPTASVQLPSRLEPRSDPCCGWPPLRSDDWPVSKFRLEQNSDTKPRAYKVETRSPNPSLIRTLFNWRFLNRSSAPRRLDNQTTPNPALPSTQTKTKHAQTQKQSNSNTLKLKQRKLKPKPKQIASNQFSMVSSSPALSFSR